MHGTVALLAANGAAPLKPQQQPLVQQNDPCLCGYMTNRRTGVSSLAGGGGGSCRTTRRPVADHLPIRAGLEPLANDWIYTTFDVNVGSCADLQRTQCQPTPRLISTLRIHQGHRGGGGGDTENPPCIPCLVCTVWHRESLKLKEKVGTREGFEICLHQFFRLQNPPPPRYQHMAGRRGRPWARASSSADTE